MFERHRLTAAVKTVIFPQSFPVVLDSLRRSITQYNAHNYKAVEITKMLKMQLKI